MVVNLDKVYQDINMLWSFNVSFCCYRGTWCKLHILSLSFFLDNCISGPSYMLQFLHEPHAAGQSTMNATKKTNRAGRQTKGVVPSVALVSILSSPGYRWKRRCSSFLFTRTCKESKTQKVSAFLSNSACFPPPDGSVWQSRSTVSPLVWKFGPI